MKNTLKKTVRFALIFILSFQLISCTQTIKETTIKNEMNENNQLVKSQEEPVIEELHKEGVDVVLNDYEKKKLDVFFSNFSKVNLKPFTKDNISDSILNPFWYKT